MILRVLLVDDDPLVRAGLRMVLSADAAIEVVGEAANGREAVEMSGRLCPDVVLMDLQMPVMDGVLATAALTELPDPPAVLVLTTFHLDEYVVGALQAGARGYLLKDTPPTEIARAVHTAAAGNTPLSPAVTRTMLARMSHTDGNSARRERALRRLQPLTERELEVAVAVAQGKPNAEIAREAHMSEATVKTHVSRALMKTQTDNRVQVARLVHDAGLLPDD
ncbi:response regulator transcription factor [Amycolatopsis acidiphila]|uniref:Response regulator transcription factor n=1 Tax=Amycolatopsis acidiphila TaxID=715473 RepID=A0A558A6J0_9PSEU|nr:response regulator transcription factor [Amycolatopsis acidiphila]TVT19871.1 response regulator transcription factor [Amycolatopsis acidiphila]UIJ64035.1 response regulator transcription factor [Amycolatopsis acidiphila]GHG71684.1 DNA-binding response regulator [Amycolatopsis acidiphila]